MYGDKQITKDYGNQPLIVNLACYTKSNPFYRTALWTGEYLQLTLMSIPVGGDIGLEMHPYLDQFIRIENGCALVTMGKDKNIRDVRKTVTDDYAVIVPAGTWHNIVNTGRIPLKIYSIYAPPQHPFGTIHRTKAEAQETENH